MIYKQKKKSIKVYVAYLYAFFSSFVVYLHEQLMFTASLK